MKRVQYMSLLVLVAMSLTGCASMQNSGGIEACLRHKHQAQMAWNEWSWCYDELNRPFHFARGFKAAYRDVIEGGNGCQPTLPPKCYWKSKFQSAEGRCKVNDWFDGYSHGALAAQQDGAGNWNQIPISPTARLNMQMAATRVDSYSGAGYGAQRPTAASAPPGLPAALRSPRDAGDGADGHLRLDDDPDDADSQTDDRALPLRPYE